MPTFLIPAKICADFLLDQWIGVSQCFLTIFLFYSTWQVHWTLQLFFYHSFYTQMVFQDIDYIKILESFSQ